MSTKLVFPCSLVLAVLGACAVRAQDVPPAPVAADTTHMPAPSAQEAVPPLVGQRPGALSSWMTYPRQDCCGPIGGTGPIQTELYAQGGISLPVEGRIWGHVLRPGFDVGGGGRSLFFNRGMDAAWAIDLGLSDIHYDGQRSDIKVPYNVKLASGTNPITQQPTSIVNQTVQTTIQYLNRTTVNAGFGREWYLWAPANDCGPRLRIGIDGGGRLGSVKVGFHELQHHTDVTAGMYAALHTDYEIPYGCCTFMIGFRAEWGYNWMDVLQKQNDADLQDVNLLMTAGVRF